MENFEKRVRRNCAHLPCGAEHLPAAQVTWKLCAGCRQVSYCNSTCQRADWPSHKGRCLGSKKQLERLADSDPMAMQVATYREAWRMVMTGTFDIVARSALRIGHRDDMTRTHHVNFSFEFVPPTEQVDLKDVNRAKAPFKFLDATVVKDPSVTLDPDWQNMMRGFMARKEPAFVYKRLIHITLPGGKFLAFEELSAFDPRPTDPMKPLRNTKLNPDWKGHFAKLWTMDVNPEDYFFLQKLQMEEFAICEGVPMDLMNDAIKAISGQGGANSMGALERLMRFLGHKKVGE